MGRTCLGYRNTTDLLFRDESARVKAKAERSSASDREQRAVTRITPVERRRSRSLSGSRLVLPSVHAIIQPDVEDTAVNFLLGHYILGGHFSYLPNMYSGPSAHDQTLSTIVKAVALASMSVQANRPELQVSARKLYVQAIASTNLTLQDQINATKDEVLASILLLSLYETVTLGPSVALSAEATRAYTMHMQGVASVVILRGESQFSSPYGRELFVQCAMSVAYCCVQDGIRIPDGLRHLAHIAEQQYGDPTMAFASLRAVDAFAELHADMAEGLLTDSPGIIARAEELLGMLDIICETLPMAFWYEKRYVAAPSDAVHGDCYYAFADHHVAKRWNTIWMAQMLLHGLVCAHLARLYAIDPTELQMSLSASLMIDDGIDANIRARQKIMREKLDDICATVPHFFPPQNEKGKQSPPSAAAGYFLVWPLYAVGINALVTPGQQEYVTGRLRKIARELNLPQAELAAEMIGFREEEREDQFMHACHVF